MFARTQREKTERTEKKALVCVQTKRKRISGYTPDQRRLVVYLFDQSSGDYDYVADRCGIVGIQRADVLAIVLADMRRKPAPAPPLRVMAKGAAA